VFSNVLVGVDGKQGGRDAIALAKQLAARGAPITLAHAYGSDWAVGGRGEGIAIAYAREDSDRLLRTERGAATIDADLVSYPCCDPGRGLHELAERREADLLVVGSSRRAVLGRALMGDDTRAALNGAPCAIAIAPRGYTSVARQITRIGVGYEGSPESEHALATARELASRYGATITGLWVVSLQNVRDDAPIPADWPQATEVLVHRSLGELERLGGIEPRATYGGPREELSRFGDRVDLLVVGSRRYGPIHRVFHGTTSTYLIRHISCPLLVLPRCAETMTDDGPTFGAAGAASATH
jgi:nucleotide-binding universal stress UspA family protein